MEKLNAFVSLYQNLKTTVDGKKIKLGEILSRIKDGYWKHEIVKLRGLADPEAMKRYKRSLQNFTASGEFSERKESGLISHSGVIVIDMDNLPDVSATKAMLIQDAFTFFVFVSCRGTGIAIGVKIDGTRHKESFSFLKSHYLEKYQIEIDPSCSDVSRARLISHDPELFINKESEEVELDPAPVTVPAVTVDVANANTAMNDDEKYKWCRKVQDKKKSYEATERHAYLLSIAYFLNKVGVSLGFALTKMKCDFAVPSKTEKDIENIVRHCYDRKDEHDTYHINNTNAVTQDEYDAAELRPIYAHVHQKNKEGKLWDDKDVAYLANEYKVPKEMVRNIYSFIYSAHEDEHNLFRKPPSYIVEWFLNNHYEFKRNVVTLSCDYRKLGESHFKKVNVDSIYRHLQLEGIKYSLPDLKSKINSDFVPEYNPFIEYFESLPAWDGVDHISKLASFVIADHQEFFDAQFKKMLIRCIACSLYGYINRIVFVLVSAKQELGKSTFLRFLNPFGTKYYTEAPMREDKDSEFRFSENFFYNMEELDSLNNIGVNRLKAIISKSIVKERKPYAVDEEEHPRRTNFIGSTNKEEFLTDNVNSRWLCFKIDDILWDYKTEIDIDKVWSQAFHLYNSNAEYELSQDEQRQREEINKTFEVRSNESELITKHFMPCNPELDDDAEFWTVSEIMSFILEGTKNKFQLHRVAVGRAMVQLGFKGDRKRFNGTMQRGYHLKRAGDTGRPGDNYDKPEAGPLFEL